MPRRHYWPNKLKTTSLSGVLAYKGNMSAQHNNQGPLAVGDLVEDKYRVLELMQSNGGMSNIYRAQHEISGAFYAIKTPKNVGLSGDELLPFQREIEALTALSHQNIIALEDVGRNSDGSPSLVLKWHKCDLVNRITESGRMDWKRFYECYGRPILEGLRHAHTRRFSHRDLKPHNILLDEFDHPKIIDFGLARSIDKPQIGPTLKFAGSQPYTPPETDDGYLPERRDVYSWAAISVSCLTGKIYQDLPALQAGLRALREGEVPKAELEKALSVNRDDRHETAFALLAQTDQFHTDALERAKPKVTIYVSWSPSCLDHARAEQPNLQTEDSIKAFVVGDINIECAATLDETGVTPILSLVGATVRLNCLLDTKYQDRFFISRVYFDSLSVSQMRRESMPKLTGISLHFGNPPIGVNSAQQVRSLFTCIQMAEEQRQRVCDERSRYKWFDCWNTFLREKDQFHKSKQRKLRAQRIQPVDENQFVATISDEFSSDDVGGSVVIQLASGRPLIFEVDRIVADQLFLRLVAGVPHLVPRKNAILEGNYEAERQAISRQRNAVEEIRQERAVNPRLLQLICDPSSAAAPELAGLNASSTNLSEDKLAILDAALGVQSIHVVKGPPGTGKTTLIAELISIYLQRYPDRRILLSSQTHVALDHVIAKLQENLLGDEIVRVVSTSATSAMKVQPTVRELTLDRKALKWAEAAEVRARKFIQNFAAAIGIDNQEIEAAILGEHLLNSKRRLAQLHTDLQALSTEEKRIDNEREKTLNDTGRSEQDQVLIKTTTLVDRRYRVKQECDSVISRISRLENDLRACGPYGATIVDADEAMAHEWISVLGSSAAKGSQLQSLVALQLEWFDRLGDVRCLHGAVLSESRVAAGTCIGLASTPAIYQQSYDLCIIDEASKATATETLVPMARSKSWILVGDPEQLPPFFEDRSHIDTDEESVADLEKTMLTIMLESVPSTNKGALTQQRRMVMGIGQMISDVFYDGALENVRSNDDRRQRVVQAFPKPVTWISTSAKRFREHQSGQSFANSGEVQVVIECLQRLNRAPRREQGIMNIAVIASYAAQVRALLEAVDQIKAGLKGMEVEVNTVDAFQGRDADICIYSVTRSNDNQKLGFQRERRRLNVALSRAKDSLVIVGDVLFCKSVAKNNPFLRVLDHISANPDFCTFERA